MSREAILGAGISVASIGVLFLLLGLAQAMRHAADASIVLLVIGAICLVAGIFGALSARKR